MKHGRKRWDRDQKARLLALGIRFFMAAALTGNQVQGGYAPFALGCVAAAGAGGTGVAALLGTIVGAALFLPFSDALAFLAVGILILAAATAFRGNPFLARPQSLSLTSTGLFLAVNLIYITQSFTPLEELPPCLAAAGLTGASAWFFWPLLHPGQGRSPSEGILFLSAALLLALREISGLSLGRMLLCVLLAWTGYSQGAAVGAAAGLGVGLTADLCAGSGGVFTAGMGLAGLLCGHCDGRRYRAALLFLAGTFTAAVSTAAARTLLIESGAGMILFLLLPGKLFEGKRVQRPESRNESAGGNRIRERLNRAAAALRDLYDSVGRVGTAEEENPAIIFDRAAERVCRGCALCELCWQKEYSSTFQALNDATPFLIERGRAMQKDFSASFSARCIHLPDFITAVNGELSAFLLRRQYRKQLEQTRRSAQGQYEQLSELLSATAAGLEETVPVFQARQPACRLGAALRPRQGERVCGDTVLSFQTEEGLLCLLLADGMGSGESARRESALTCRLLRQFLEAGIHPEAALKTLNSAMALRGAETGSFTTMDLCTFHIASGEAAFYKYGAAPSYLKKGGLVRRITGASLPVGLRATPGGPDVTRLRLEPGSFAVMISDGVTDPERDEWLQDLLAGWTGDDPQELAGLILSESVRRNDLQDDCGVQILYRPDASRS